MLFIKIWVTSSLDQASAYATGSRSGLKRSSLWLSWQQRFFSVEQG